MNYEEMNVFRFIVAVATACMEDEKPRASAVTRERACDYISGILDIALSRFGIGYHVHETDAELFYILKGTGTYSDNGEIVTLHPGDVAICATGQGHSIANAGDEVLEFVALIVYA